MKPGSIQIIMDSIEINCPLCTFICNSKRNDNRTTFKFKKRYTLRMHLNKDHTENEIEKYIKKFL